MFVLELASLRSPHSIGWSQLSNRVGHAIPIRCSSSTRYLRMLHLLREYARREGLRLRVRLTDRYAHLGIVAIVQCLRR
jgi:hypothetical protein